MRHDAMESGERDVPTEDPGFKNVTDPGITNRFLTSNMRAGYSSPATFGSRSTVDIQHTSNSAPSRMCGSDPALQIPHRSPAMFFTSSRMRAEVRVSDGDGALGAIAAYFSHSLESSAVPTRSAYT